MGGEGALAAWNSSPEFQSRPNSPSAERHFQKPVAARFGSSLVFSVSL